MKEIIRLKEMLEYENIPFEFTERKEMEGFQIGYPKLPPGNCVCSVIQHIHSYGNNDNLIEIMGLSHYDDDVEGYLSAEEVCERIKRHYKAGGIDERS